MNRERTQLYEECEVESAECGKIRSVEVMDSVECGKC